MIPFDLPSNFPAGLYPLVVLAASLLGSWHCAGMCGPIACSSGLQGQSHLYHLGRLVSYVSLGLLAGGLGQSLLSNEFFSLKYVAAASMGLLLMSLGVGFFFGWNWPLEIMKRYGIKAWKPILPFLSQRTHQKFLLGFFTALLPCGWLYSFVLVASATHSVWLGGVTLLIFWTGTVPALLMMSAGFRRLVGIPPAGIRKAVGAIFILAGIYSVWAQIYMH